jgi:hypothetical protein
MRDVTRHLHTVVAVALLTVAATVVATARADTKAQSDPKFDFTRLKTFGWHTPPGEVKIWVTKQSNERAEPTRRQYEPVLMQAVETEMVKRGYARASGAAPDFELTYYVLITVGTAAQQAGQFLDANYQFGIPLFAPQTTSLSVYPQGSIVLDAKAAGTMIWRGIVEAKVETVASEAERSKRVQGFIKDVVAKFPKPKK